MSNQTIIRAWKDIDFCSTLSEEELTLLPANPVGKTLGELDIQANNLATADVNCYPTFFCPHTTYPGCVFPTTTCPW